MAYPKPLKLHGINMTVEEWFKLLIPNMKKLAKEEINAGRVSRPSYRTVNSLSDALQSIDWDTSLKGREFWETHTLNLVKGDLSIVNTKNIMQILH